MKIERLSLVKGWALAALAIATAASGADADFSGEAAAGLRHLSEQARREAPDGPDAVTRLTERSMPAVVRLEAGGAVGTGFLVRKDGLVATAAHVVARAGVGGRVKVITNQGESLEGVVEAAGYVEGRDLAFVRIQSGRADWRVLWLGDSRMARIGRPVVAMGYPIGLPFSVSRGIVSGLPRDMNPYVTLIQTDAAINPGNSGGPVMTLDGMVVGVADFIYKNAQNLGFAIAAEDVRAALTQFEKTGRVESSSPRIGLAYEDGAPLRVSAVRPSSPAEKAGVRAGDVIAWIGDAPCPPRIDLAVRAMTRAVAARAPGEVLALTLEREGERRQARLVLEAAQYESTDP